MLEAVVSIGRDALSLPPLEIFGTCGEVEDVPYWITFEGLRRPSLEMKRSYIPGSAWVSGQMLLAASEDVHTLDLSLIVNGISHEDLSAKMSELEQATSQFFYTVSLTIDGQTTTWDADSSLPQWGTVEYLLQYLVKVRGSLQIPIYS